MNPAAEKNWNKSKWIFESDGSLRDIYVQNVNESDWRKLISFLNTDFKLKLGNDPDNSSDKIDFDFIQKMWNDETGTLESRSLTIDLNGIIIKSYFFCPEQIEFDINPREVKSLSDLNQVLEFMLGVSRVLNKQVTLTWENQAEFPLIKIDYEKGLEKILTKEEMLSISKRAGIYVSWIVRLKKMFFPTKISLEELEYKAMESACKPMEPVSQEQNVW